MSERNDAKLMGNFRKLVDFCVSEASYNPPNPILCGGGDGNEIY